jgi:aspartate aminotransferase
MIEVNKHIKALKHSATLVVNQKVNVLRNNGEEVYHFGFGQSPFHIHDNIVKALKDNAHNNHYLPTQGLPELQKKVSRFLQIHQNIKMPAEAIFIGPGSKELLYQIITLLEGVFFIPQASWVSYLPQVKSKGGNYKIIETSFKKDYKLEASKLEQECELNPDIQKSLILNSPNNPTGAVYSEAELQAIATVCKKYGIIVLSDEIYSQINFNEIYSPSISKYYPKKTLVFGGLSKVFSAGGYRLGYVAVPQTLKELCTPLKALISETFSCVSAPVQYAAIKAYEFDKDLQDYVLDCTTILKYIANYIYKELTVMDVVCTKPQGAFYMLIDFENYRKQLFNLKIFNVSDLTAYLLDNYNVALLPGTDFYFPKESLTCRLATVDFEGAKVYDAFKDGNNLDISFIKRFTPLISEGLKQIKNFLTGLG